MVILASVFRTDNINRTVHVRYFRNILVLFLLLTAFQTGVYGQNMTMREKRLSARAMDHLEEIPDFFADWQHVGEVKVDSIKTDATHNVLYIWFKPSITHIPVRWPWIHGLRAYLSGRLGFRFRNYATELIARGRPLEEYIPNYFRMDFAGTDPGRSGGEYKSGKKPLIVNMAVCNKKIMQLVRESKE